VNGDGRPLAGTSWSLGNDAGIMREAEVKNKCG
jgi:hypothetical protein